MNPVTLAMLIGAGGSAVGALPSLIPGKMEREQKKRLEELRKREAEGLLGLTTREEAAISGKLRGAADQASEQMEQRQKALLAGGGVAAGGQALASAVGLQQERMAQESAIGEKVLQADIAEREREIREERALEAAVEQKRMERFQSAVGIAGAGIEAGIGTAAQQAIIQGQKDISPSKIAGLSNQLSISEEEARGMYELSLENPEVFEMLKLIDSKRKL